MESRIQAEFLATNDGRKADEIIRKCVHCGFCLATCPTYQVLGDERDSPRGRIYLIKELLEGEVEAKTVQHHLDRCLTCRACETTCPSGVEYGKLVDIGRDVLQQKQTPRAWLTSVKRFFLARFLVDRKTVNRLVSLAKTCKSILPAAVKHYLSIDNPSDHKPPVTKKKTTKQRVILFQGCVQPTLTPATNHYAKLVLNKLNIEVITLEQETCCGALPQHLSYQQQSIELIKKNIDVWWPLIADNNFETSIISAASACSLQIKDYTYLLREHPQYLEKAETIVEHCYELSEYLLSKDLSELFAEDENNTKRIAFHAPCTLQHGLKIQGSVETILQKCGYEVVTPKDAHLCCGSAGTYSILQPDLSKQLQQKKITELEKLGADVIVSANIGCQMHLQSATALSVKHWIELLA